MNIAVGIGILGCGTVGTAVATRLLEERDALIARAGVSFTLLGIAVGDATKSRSAAINASLFTDDARALVDDPRIDIIVECIGGTTLASELVESALYSGRHVVSANKDLLATQGPRLHALASARGGLLRYEAAVGSAIPVLRIIGEALAGDRVDAVAGVLNGTCNFILEAMENGASYADALAQAQALGYAEADPRNDVEGIDTTHKLAVLAQLSFGVPLTTARIASAGIANITQRDVARAQMLEYHIRLVAAARRTDDGILAQVAPVLVHASHPFAQLHGPENAITVIGRDSGALLLRGQGAGGNATASAVLGDIISALRAIAERRTFLPQRLRAHGDPHAHATPLFDRLARNRTLPRYAVCEDTILTAPVSSLLVAHSRPGKDTLA